MFRKEEAGHRWTEDDAETPIAYLNKDDPNFVESELEQQDNDQVSVQDDEQEYDSASGTASS